MIFETERAAVFIDGYGTHYTCKSLGIEIDYRKLSELIRRQTTVIRNYYFTPLVEGQDFIAVKPLLDFLQYNGWTTVTRPYKEHYVSTNTALAVTAMEIAPAIEQAIIFSGNGDFTPLIEALKRRGIHTTVASTVRSEQSYCSDDLRRAADAFIDLDDIRSAISREPRNEKANSIESV